MSSISLKNWPVQRRQTISTESLRRKSLIGGSAITYDVAKELRQVVYGSSIRGFSRDWRRAAFCLQPLDSDFPYGLHAQKCGSRGVVMCVQAHIMMYLCEKYRGGTDFLGCSALQPSGSERKMALVYALSHILWRAGQELGRCYVCLPQDSELFDPTPHYHHDGLTEKLLLFEFTKYDELEQFMRRHVQFFEEDGARGCILFVYSVVLSRTTQKVYKDAGTTKIHLIGHMEEVTMPLANLLLTGRATRYIHNGTLVYDKDGELLEPPLVGIGERSEIGLLYWEKMEDEGNRTEVGSMYRTPKTPIWVTWINHTQFGVLFCLKTDLVSDWRAENWFTLNYYNGLPGQPKTSLTIGR
ncbi:hypothetical protein NP493_743g03004 [Ridgeia piscesae]|uniref:Ubiquitin carboxyl-terminal hydrolase MINDY n=1 Tax=Ridgeia piscesae TaxID=27915 RepID=A0AAD9NNV6_RIDPI|nr:hypothetical protein NP493_743g03004 [Ridgeia piscesae]